MAFANKDFDTILNEILTDYQNQFPGIDVSQGSLVFIKSACMASALWGLYKAVDYAARQIFPDTADPANLERHAWVRGISRTQGETDAALLARVLDSIRHPPAGGNKHDYEQWALSIDNVAAAWCFPIAQGPGTVDVVILANKTNTGSESPSSHATLTGTNTSVSEGKLVDSAATFVSDGATAGDKVVNVLSGISARIVSVDGETELTLDADIFTDTDRSYEIMSLCGEVSAYIDTVRPVTASAVRVIGPTILTQPVTMTLTGTGLDAALIADDVQGYMEGLAPGQTLYRSRLVHIALEAGADDAVVTTPAADVTPSGYEMIRPGAINVA